MSLHLTKLQKQLCNALQDGLPICSRPFAEIAEELNSDEETVLQQIGELKSAGVIRRLRAVINHRVLGKTSTLVAAHVPKERLPEVTEAVNSLENVSHNYLRDHFYNLWFTLQAPKSRQIKVTLSSLSDRFGIDFHSLPVTRFFKLDVRFDAEDAEQVLLGDVRKPKEQTVELEANDKLILSKLQDELAVTSEPFARLFNQGLINAKSYRIPGGKYISPAEAKTHQGELISAVEKMSKSKLNVVSPDEIVEESGADALRLYLMFMGPLDKDKVWETSGVNGCRRFLSRFYDLATSPRLYDETTEEALRLGHVAIAGVTRDIEALHFNTAISKLMEFVNNFSKLERYPREVLRMVTQLLAPLAPHMAEEIWEMLGGEGSVMFAPWPHVDHTYLEQATITYVVQVNGKVRARISVPTGADEETIETMARREKAVRKYISAPNVVVEQVKIVPNQIISFATGPASPEEDRGEI